jgi:hypothetical protein
MAFLTIDGTAVDVDRENADLQFDLVGERARAFDGTMRSTQRAVKRRWHVITPPIPAAQAEALRLSLVDPAAPRAVGGQMTGGQAVQCEVELGRIKFVSTTAGPLATVEFTLDEV